MEGEKRERKGKRGEKRERKGKGKAMHASPAKKGRTKESSTVETFQSWKSAQEGTSYALRNAFKNDKWLASSMKAEERILLKFQHSSAFNAAMEAADIHHKEQQAPIAKSKSLIPKRKNKKTQEQEYEVNFYLEQAKAWGMNRFKNEEEEASSDDAKDAEYGDRNFDNVDK